MSYDTAEEIAERGHEIYDQEIRTKVETGHCGEFLVINILTGEYELDADDVAASQRAKARFGNAPLFTVRVGHQTAYRLGGAAWTKPA